MWPEPILPALRVFRKCPEPKYIFIIYIRYVSTNRNFKQITDSIYFRKLRRSQNFVKEKHMQL